MLIEVKKVSVVKRRIADNSIVRNPLSSSRSNNREGIKDEFQVFNECIRIDEIKSIRKWNKTTDEEKEIEGEVTMIYLMGDRSKAPAQMKINESYNSFKQRCPVVCFDGE